MANDIIDPREVDWHPRHRAEVVGHTIAVDSFKESFSAGKPHHAWLITGKIGIGKATYAYAMARWLLSHSRSADTAARWVSARSHPDLFVLERKMADKKPARLKAEISVEDARGLLDFFARTASGDGWRVAIVDAADDLNVESANALLKIIEEPPPQCIILIVCHQPGRLLRTIKSRCLKLPLARLSDDLTNEIVMELPPLSGCPAEEVRLIAKLAEGSPGTVLNLAESEGAAVFSKLLEKGDWGQMARLKAMQGFSPRGPSQADFEIFTNLLTHLLAERGVGSPGTSRGHEAATLHAQILAEYRAVSGFNLDRKQAILEQLARCENALKAA